ncbi:MAG: DUF4405 domain-containing protein [Arcobacter sp.]|jgi:5-bromo-4-chloroindolyl phosphate hydrolysis protein|uniref:DUF4405 domain-containing membrane protein n=1 Tax=Arcobacter defluvii TaxID=873191 RepID=A0AAE7BEM1_9BACT|nr:MULTISPECIES: DUF4405 domain-containing protein [Arcobacter]MDY3201316.1 DUF4405 domain-containing protein [Arcobacter sp.]QKF76379.1 DUF4405 domain-containing membrane protein [Arcobacter defluvii]RXI34530.1 DUF4405 domain-containing protein [Arcobacter defluvii]BAK72180.1 conserved hypothetical protein [Arcobacter sp. L]
MNKFLKRDIATSFTTFLFLVMGITGVLMYFHILDNYTKEMHEILGLVFVLVIFFHVFFNWKAMKSYFSKKVFLSAGIIISIVALTFILNAKTGENPKAILINKTLEAPIETSFLIFSKNIENAKEKLEKAGIKLEKANSLKELASINKTSPFEIINILSQDK